MLVSSWKLKLKLIAFKFLDVVKIQELMFMKLKEKIWQLWDDCLFSYFSFYNQVNQYEHFEL